MKKHFFWIFISTAIITSGLLWNSMQGGLEFRRECDQKKARLKEMQEGTEAYKSLTAEIDMCPKPKARSSIL